MHTAPGMACLFGFFSIAIVGFAIFREHGWRTWPRLRAAGIGAPRAAGRQARRAGRARAAQHVVLFGFGVAFLDFKVNGAWLAVALLALAFAAMILWRRARGGGGARTVQQLNAVTNLGTMVLGGLGGALVPVMELPEVGPAARAGLAGQLGDGGLPRRRSSTAPASATSLLPLAAMLGLPALLAAIALWRLRSTRRSARGASACRARRPRCASFRGSGG